MANTASNRSGSYQVLLVGLLSLNFGIVFFDRNSLNFLMPFVKPDLGLTNEQVGIFQSALSLTWALAAFGIGRLSDRIGNRKLLLVLSTLIFSVCSFLTGLAQGFALLLGARLLMGAAEGGVMPISHAMVASEVSPARRGLAQGIAQNFGSNLLGSFVAPVLLVSFAAAFGWRHAFYLAGIPGLVSAVLIWFLIREPEAPAHLADEAVEKASPWAVLRERNVLLCCLLSVILVSYLVVCWVFMRNDTEGTFLLMRPVTDIVNASLTYNSPGKNWNVTVGGTNLTNDRYLVTGQAQIAGGEIYGTYSRPAEWYVRVGFNF